MLSVFTETILRRTMSNTYIPESNRKAMQDYANYLQAKGRKQATLQKVLYSFEKFLIALGDVEVSKAQSEDINKALSKISNQKLSSETTRQIRVVIIQFYRHFYGEDEFKPKCVRGLKTTITDENSILPNDLVNEEDVIKLLNACKNPRDSAIISTLYETGIRASELLNMKKQDAIVDILPCRVVIRVSKTEPREIPISYSAGYIMRYLKTIKYIESNEFLWRGLEANHINGQQEPIAYDSLRMMLKEVSKRAKLSKKTNAHAFRHATATRLSAYQTNPEAIRLTMGWSKKSNMLSRYTHMQQSDIDNQILKANGYDVKSKVIKRVLVAKQCKRCEFPNPIDAVYCEKCSSLLNLKKADDTMRNKELLRELFVKAIQDNKTFDEIFEKMKQKN